MFIDTLNQSNILIQEFPVQEIALVLNKPKQDILAYYENWKNSKKTANPNFDQAFIAGLVGQSKTTVSNFINQRFQNISAPKQEILSKVVELLDYKPSQSAQLIRAKEKKMIGVVANITKTPSKDYTSSILEGIKAQANEYQYGLLIYDVTQGEQSDFIQRMPFLGLVDGLIIIGAMLEAPDYRILARHQLPVSLINPWGEIPKEYCGSGFSSNVVGSIKADLIGMDDLFQHYQELVQSPVLLTVAVDKYKQRQKKIALYQKYFASEIVFLDNYSVAAVEKAVTQMDLTQYDAFFCLADLVAICLKQRLQQLGHQALVTGYDNTDLARVFNIPTVNHNIEQQGVGAFNNLFMALSYKKINQCFPSCEFRELKSRFVEASA